MSKVLYKVKRDGKKTLVKNSHLALLKCMERMCKNREKGTAYNSDGVMVAMVTMSGKDGLFPSYVINYFGSEDIRQTLIYVALQRKEVTRRVWRETVLGAYYGTSIREGSLRGNAPSVDFIVAPEGMVWKHSGLPVIACSHVPYNFWTASEIYEMSLHLIAIGVRPPNEEEQENMDYLLRELDKVAPLVDKRSLSFFARPTSPVALYHTIECMENENRMAEAEEYLLQENKPQERLKTIWNEEEGEDANGH